jgi:hypothetical protein
MPPRILLPLLLPLLSGLAACQAEPPPTAPDQPLPKVVCDQVKAGLEKLGRAGGVEYDDKGEASMFESAWTQLTGNQRDQLVKLLAYHASCAAGAQSDGQTVVIRGDQGQELTRRTVSTKIDVAGALGGLGEDVAR